MRYRVTVDPDEGTVMAEVDFDGTRWHRQLDGAYGHILTLLIVRQATTKELREQ